VLANSRKEVCQHVLQRVERKHHELVQIERPWGRRGRKLGWLIILNRWFHSFRVGHGSRREPLAPLGRVGRLRRTTYVINMVV
jgi:hypothetical protein